MTYKDLTFQYAVKFVCGSADGGVPPPPEPRESPETASGILARGVYFTAVNVHNPTNKEIEFRKKFALALPRQQPGPICPRPSEEPLRTRLGPDQALEIDCPEIRDRIFECIGPKFPIDFLKGFVVIESDVELDVVAVYTAAGADGQVETLHIERVPPRRREVLPCPQQSEFIVEVDDDCNPDGTRTVTFDTSITLSGPGTVQAQWDFGDGTSGVPFTIPPASHSETHNYAPGTYTATLRFLPPADCTPQSFTIFVGQCPPDCPEPSTQRSTRIRLTAGS